MEYGLRHLIDYFEWYGINCLNPCCNGIWSQTTQTKSQVVDMHCLNPCCNGIWSQTVSLMILSALPVLILVVMEYGLRRTDGVRLFNYYTCSLNPCCNGIWSQTTNKYFKQYFFGLNPCCNGIWSQTEPFDDEFFRYISNAINFAFGNL